MQGRGDAIGGMAGEAREQLDVEAPADDGGKAECASVIVVQRRRPLQDGRPNREWQLVRGRRPVHAFDAVPQELFGKKRAAFSEIDDRADPAGAQFVAASQRFGDEHPHFSVRQGTERDMVRPT